MNQANNNARRDLRHPLTTTFPIFLIDCTSILPILLIVYDMIQPTAGHHSRHESRTMIKELVVEAMNKHDQDFDD